LARHICIHIVVSMVIGLAYPSKFHLNLKISGSCLILEMWHIS